MININNMEHFEPNEFSPAAHFQKPNPTKKNDKGFAVQKFTLEDLLNDMGIPSALAPEIWGRLDDKDKNPNGIAKLIKQLF